MDNIYCFTTYRFNTANAQIKMNNEGEIGLGGDPRANYLLNVGGKAYFSSIVTFFGTPKFHHGAEIGTIHSPSGYVKFDGVTVTAYLEGMSLDNVGTLGTSTKKWSAVHAQEVYCNDVPLSSDERLKENIQDLQGSKNRLLELRPVSFDFKKPNIPVPAAMAKYTSQQEHNRNRAGFLAQDVKNIFPEFVYYDSVADLHYISYISFIPHLVNLVQEQQAAIEKLEAALNEPKLKSASISTDNEDDLLSTETALYQNVPNPFNETTEIAYHINEKADNASLYIYDMNGTQLKSIPISQKGKGSITINGGELTAGMYFYALIADGQVIDTKRMILTK